MNFKQLGNTELKVSSICLGTMTWGNQNTKEEAFEQMDYAFDQGINFFDTAELYPVPMDAKHRGRTSQFIGEWLTKTKNRKFLSNEKMMNDYDSGFWLNQYLLIRLMEVNASINEARIKRAKERAEKRDDELTHTRAGQR